MIKHASLQLMTVMMYMYLLITVQLKGKLLWLLVLVVTSQWISQHQFGHLTRADPENSERGGPGGVAGALASHVLLDTIYFSRNQLTIIQNFTEKGVTAVHSAHP